jgi:cytochrome b pre-mRNA-processing protein 3
MLSVFKRSPVKAEADAIFRSVAGQARHPALFLAGGVPDTVEGRFESLSLHVILVVLRIEGLGPQGAELAQELVDRFFADLDRAVREIGIGDLSVGKKVKAFARSFYGRVDAYRAGLAATADAGDLAAALHRNLLGADGPAGVRAEKLAHYARASVDRLAQLDRAGLGAAKVHFAPEVLA